MNTFAHYRVILSQTALLVNGFCNFLFAPNYIFCKMNEMLIILFVFCSMSKTILRFLKKF